MRMADNRTPLQRTFARSLQESLETTNRAVDKQLLGDRMLVHRESGVDRFMNTAVKL